MSAKNEALVRLEDWSRATHSERQRALELSLERIRSMDPDIHAWVQVLPQPEIGNGPLSGIPFGVKDIIETQKLVTEYGSPIYKGRQGVADARNSPAAAESWGNTGREDGGGRVRIPDAATNPQSAESRTHPRWQLQRVGCRCRR